MLSYLGGIYMITNFLMADLDINKMAFEKSKENPILEFNEDFLLTFEKYIENLDFNVTQIFIDYLDFELDQLKSYLYLCIDLNSSLDSESKSDLYQDTEFFDYNLIVLNTLIFN